MEVKGNGVTEYQTLGQEKTLDNKVFTDTLCWKMLVFVNFSGAGT
jgi:hypothetical protein